MMAWEELQHLIEENHVIPVIGKQLYKIDKKVGNSTYNSLYNYLAKVIAPAEDENIEFAAACRQFLEAPNQDDLDLSKILRTHLQEIQLVPENPLLKLAGIKNFNIFLNTTYDDFLIRILKKVRRCPIDTISYQKSQSNLKGPSFETLKEIERSEHNLVFNIFGTFKGTAPAYKEESLLETIKAFHKDIEEIKDANLVSKLLNSHLLFLGFEYDDWLFWHLINTLSNTAYAQESFKLLIGDNFSKKNPHTPFQKWLLSLEKYGAVGFYPTDEDDGNLNFIDSLVENMQDQVISPKDYPGEVFISFQGKDREIAKKLTDQLRKDDINMWLDMDNTRGGEKVDKTIIKAIDRCSFFIPLISRNSADICNKNGELNYHIREWEWALYKHSISKEFTIIPVILDNEVKMYKGFEGIIGLNIPNGEDGEYEKLKEQLPKIRKIYHE